MLSSLAFPPSSRFAKEKTQLHEGNRPASGQTNSTAVAAAVAAAAVAAVVAAADGGILKAEQGASSEDGRDPNVGYNARGEMCVRAGEVKCATMQGDRVL